MHCPLCSGSNIHNFSKDKRRDYYRCHNCLLVFVPQEQRLSEIDEKAEYDKHENSPNDQGYREFLSRMLTPMLQRIENNAAGLDFGSGPGPTLSVMFAEHGIHVQNYDIFYNNDESLLQKQYDFITCTEVVEHLFQPGCVIKKLLELLSDGGWLGIMTKRVINQQSFKSWHYKNDLTHVCFFSEETFEWIGNEHNCSVEFTGNDVVLVRKNPKF